VNRCNWNGWLFRSVLAMKISLFPLFKSINNLAGRLSLCTEALLDGFSPSRKIVSLEF
jgi:hypothetical protein